MSTEKHWYEEWFGDEYLRLYQQRDHSAAESEIRELVTILSAIRSENPSEREISDVVDVGCGAGRHTEQLAKIYRSVTGVDLSEALLAKAQMNGVNIARSGNPVPRYVHSDMRHLPFENNSADLLTSLFNSFGYFCSDAEHQHLLEEWWRVLRPKGTLVIDFFNRSQVIKNLVPSSNEVHGSSTYDITRLLIKDGERVEKTITVHAAAGEKIFRESVRLYSPAELEVLIQKAGFQIISKHDGFSSKPFDIQRSKQILIVAEKLGS